MADPDKPSIDQVDHAGHSRARARMLETIEAFLQKAERRQLTLRVPREEGVMQKIEGMHFHFKPEIFFQIAGRTRFECPKETLDVREQEICILPAGVPHKETVSTDKQAFRNLVAGFYSHTMSLHFAREVAPGKPDIDAIEFFDAPDLATYLTVTNSIVHVFHMQTPAREQVLKGLLLALLGMFKNSIATGMGALNGDVGKVFQAKWLVREQFSNPGLSVATIAKRLQCSADYLSHLFHTQTKEKLIHYIQRIRVDGAAVALENSRLYVSEIAYSSGFSEAAYFARVFKKHRGETPKEFRARIEHERSQREASPKTIYFDREDYSAGKAVPPAGIGKKRRGVAGRRRDRAEP